VKTEEVGIGMAEAVEIAAVVEMIEVVEIAVGGEMIAVAEIAEAAEMIGVVATKEERIVKVLEMTPTLPVIV